MWVYANVLYPLDQPQTGAGYYYAVYTAETVNISSVVEIVTPDRLQAAGVRETLTPSLMIETFEGDWEKEWFTYKPEEWARQTHKIYDTQYHAPPDAKLALEVRSAQPNTLVVGIDQYAAEIQLKGNSQWQPIVLNQADFSNAVGAEIQEWTGSMELRLGARETINLRENGEDQRRSLGAEWQGDKPVFRNLRWMRE